MLQLYLKGATPDLAYCRKAFAGVGSSTSPPSILDDPDNGSGSHDPRFSVGNPADGVILYEPGWGQALRGYTDPRFNRATIRPGNVCRRLPQHRWGWCDPGDSLSRAHLHIQRRPMIPLAGQIFPDRRSGLYHMG